MQRPDLVERNRKIAEEYLAGATPAELGRKYGMTRQATSLIIRRMGIANTSLGNRQSQAQLRAMLDRIAVAMASGMKTSEIAAMINKSERYTANLMTDIRTGVRGPTASELPNPVLLSAEQPAAMQLIVLASKHAQFNYSQQGSEYSIVRGRRYHIHEFQPLGQGWWVTAQDSITKRWWFIPEEFFDWNLPDYEPANMSPVFIEPEPTKAPTRPPRKKPAQQAQSQAVTA